MKKQWTVLLMILLLILPALAQDDDDDENMPLTVAFVDLQRVQEEWIEVQEFMRTMQTMVQEKESEVQPKLDEYERQLMELQEQLNQPISDERRAEIEAEQQAIYDKAMQERDNAVSSLEAQEAQGLGKLYDRIYEAIDQVGEDAEFDLILDVSAVLYIREAYDITDKVIELLNETAGT